MMMRRIKIGVIALVALMALTSTVNAIPIVVPGGSLTVTPQNFSIAPGQTKTLIATFETPIDTATAGYNALTYNIISVPLNLSVTGIYYYDTATGTNVSVKYTPNPASYGGNATTYWNGPAGTYYITMTVGASPAATPAKGYISFTAKSTNYSFATGSFYVNSTVYTTYASITPEFLTLALVGVGAAAIVLLRRREF